MPNRLAHHDEYPVLCIARRGRSYGGVQNAGDDLLWDWLGFELAQGSYRVDGVEQSDFRHREPCVAKCVRQPIGNNLGHPSLLLASERVGRCCGDRPRRYPTPELPFGARSLGCVGGRRNLSGVANRMNCELGMRGVPVPCPRKTWSCGTGRSASARKAARIHGHHGRPSAFARRSRVHRGPPQAVVICIAITAAAFEAAAASLPFGSVGFESAPKVSA